MLKLTKRDLSNIADRYIAPYLEDNPGTENVNILEFARNYLGINIRYGEMSTDDDSVLAVTAFADTVFYISDEEFYLLAENDVLVNEILMSPEMEGRRNFTIAHECAHHILKRTFPLYLSADLKQFRSAKKRSGPKTEEEWFEWQADCIASCLLMPEAIVNGIFEQYDLMPYIRLYPGLKFLFKDMMVISALKNKLKVSTAAVVKRLNDLGRVKTVTMKEYIKMSFLEPRPLSAWVGEEEYSVEENYTRCYPV